MPKFSWDEDKIASFTKFLIAVTLITALTQPIMFRFGVIVSNYIHASIRDFFGLPYPGGIISDVRRFYEFWLTALGIHFGYFVLDAFLPIIFKLKPRLCILCSSIITTVVSVTVFEMGTPTGWAGFFVIIDYHISYGFLFAMIMFSTYTLSTILFEKFIGIGKWKSMFLSFILSCFIGMSISFHVWRVLIRHFFGI